MTATFDSGVTTVTTPMIQVGPEAAGRTAETARRLAAVADGHIDDPRWVAGARDAWSELPIELRQPLLDFRRASGPTGSVLVRGLPVEESTLPPTPTAKCSVQRTATVPAAVLLMIAAGLGDPAAFRAEKTGALVQDVVPVPGQEEFQGNAGSVLLAFHNENAFHPHRPDFVMLLCLRADHDRVAGLRTGCVRQALPLLSEEDRAALSRPEFVTAAPPSFGSGSGGTVPHPILFGAPEDQDVRVDFEATQPLNPGAGRAMAALQEAFGKTAQTAILEPGDLAVVDNRITVHGRTSFTPRYDGRDRWLQRSFILTDLRRSRSCRDADGYVLD